MKPHQTSFNWSETTTLPFTPKWLAARWQPPPCRWWCLQLWRQDMGHITQSLAKMWIIYDWVIYDHEIHYDHWNVAEWRSIGIDVFETEHLDCGRREVSLNYSEEVDNAPLPKHQAAHTSNGQLLVSQAWANHAEGVLVQMFHRVSPTVQRNKNMIQPPKFMWFHRVHGWFMIARLAES